MKRWSNHIATAIVVATFLYLLIDTYFRFKRGQWMLPEWGFRR
jgi:hypothetical protein